MTGGQLPEFTSFERTSHHRRNSLQSFTTRGVAQVAGDDWPLATRLRAVALGDRLHATRILVASRYNTHHTGRSSAWLERSPRRQVAARISAPFTYNAHTQRGVAQPG